MKKKPVLFLVLAIVIAFIIDMNVSFFDLRTDLISLIVYWFGLTHSPSGGMIFGAGIGFLEDALMSSIIGPSMLGKAFVGFLASFFSHTFFKWTPLLGFIVAMPLTIIGGLVEFASLSIFANMERGFVNGLFPLFVQGLINGLLATLLKPQSEQI